MQSTQVINWFGLKMCTIVAMTSADLNLHPGSRTEYLGSRDFIHSWWDHLKNFHRAECIKSLTIIHDRYPRFSPLMTDPMDAATTQQWCHHFFRWSSYRHAAQSSPGPSKYPVMHMCSAVNDLSCYIAMYLPNVGRESLTTILANLLSPYRYSHFPFLHVNTKNTE